jgi:hypothetical protein
MMEYQLPNGIEVMSYLDPESCPETAFGLRQRRIVLGKEGDPTRPILFITHFPPNAVTPRHSHGDVFVDAVVQGSCNSVGEWNEAGAVRWFPANAVYGHVMSGPEGCILLEFYVDEPGFAVTVDEDALTEEMKKEIASRRQRAGG